MVAKSGEMVSKMTASGKVREAAALVAVVVALGGGGLRTVQTYFMGGVTAVSAK